MDRIERYLYGALKYRTPSMMEECITVSKASQYILTSPIVAPKVSVSIELSLEHCEKRSSNAFHHFSYEKCVSKLPF